MALAWAIDGDVDGGEAEHPAPNLRPVSDETIGEFARPIDAEATSALAVLVADDEASLRSSLSAVLQTQGHRVVEAEDGGVALRLLREQDFDVFVLDLHMPKVDGMAVLRQIESPPPFVIVYSAFEFFSQHAVRDEVGAKVYRFMRKPVPPLELIAAVNDAAAERDR